jgi:enoyl-CoA hydratase/carnithine racemase
MASGPLVVATHDGIAPGSGMSPASACHRHIAPAAIDAASIQFVRIAHVAVRVRIQALQPLD